MAGRTLEDVVREVKDDLLCYCVSLHYGSQDMGLDDTGMRDDDREAMIVAVPVGFLGELRVVFQGTVASLRELDLYAEPTAVTNPPTKDDLYEDHRLRPGAFVYGSEDAVRDWPAKLEARRQHLDTQRIADTGQQFNGVLAVEGQEANGVVFAPGALRWPDDGVLLFLGFDAGVCIGKVEKIERVGDEIRGEVALYGNAATETAKFEVDEDGIVGFGLAVAVTLREREGDDGPITSGDITAVAATPESAFRAARATRVPTGQGQAEFAVWKYELDVDDEQVVRMPAGAELLYVGTQAPRDQRHVMVWARVAPCDPDEFVKRRILIRSTGHRIADEPYVGTVVFQADGGVISLVWHVFDGGEEK